MTEVWNCTPFLLILLQASTLFPETCVVARACARTHVSKFTCAIYHTHEIIIFSLFLLLLLYISHKEKFSIERFFIEDYIQEI